MVNIAGGTLQLAGGGNSQPGQVCTLIDNDASDPVVGTFAGYPKGALVTPFGSDPDIFQLSYVGGDGNDVTLTAVGGPAFTGAGTLRLERSTVSTGEGDGTIFFRIFRIGGSVGNTMYQFTTANGTATGGSDFVGVSAQDNLATGETVDSIGVFVNDDSAFEGDETFSVGLSNVSVASLGSPVSTTVTIVDNDADPGPTTTTTAGPTTTTTVGTVTTTVPESTSTTTVAAQPPADPTTTTTIAPAASLPFTGGTSGVLMVFGLFTTGLGALFASVRRRRPAG